MTEWAERPAYTGDMARCSRRFRQQLWSPNHPERRIHRIYRCINWRRCGQKDVQTEAHHPDYSNPYVVVWCCRSCHRCIESGSLKVKARWVYDYTSLVRQLPNVHRSGEVLPHRKLKVVRDEEVPF